MPSIGYTYGTIDGLTAIDLKQTPAGSHDSAHLR